MTIRDLAARNRAEHAARPMSRGQAYYGPSLPGLGRWRAWGRGQGDVVIFLVGVALGAMLVKIVLALIVR